MLAFIFLIIFTLNEGLAQENFKIFNLGSFFVGEKSLNKGTITRLDQGEIYTKSQVSDHEKGEKKEQELKFFITGLHPRACEYSLKKLSHYEDYKNKVDFIKISQYDDKIGKVYFLLDSKFLPMRMSLSFNIPRIEKPGVYDFMFDSGFFNGLKGKIHAYDYKKSCLIFTEAHWRGTHTGFPNLMVEMFSETLSKLSMETMFRVTKF